jgi:hypothetical protein
VSALGGSSSSSSSSSSGSSSTVSTGTSSSSSGSTVTYASPEEEAKANGSYYSTLSHVAPDAYAPIMEQDMDTGKITIYGEGTQEYADLMAYNVANGIQSSGKWAEAVETGKSSDIISSLTSYEFDEDYIKKHSYAVGGPLQKAVAASGEDGIFFGRMGEEVVTPEELDKFLVISDQIDLLKDLQERFKLPEVPSTLQATNMGDVKFEITLPNVENYDQFKSKLIRDPNFEKGMLTMVNNAVVGKSSLGKMRYS